jgi:hypothetical protein
VDLAAQNITVNAVIPGLVGTEGREIWADNMATQQNVTKQEFSPASASAWASSQAAGRHGRGERHRQLHRVRSRQYYNGAKILLDGGECERPAGLAGVVSRRPAYGDIVGNREAVVDARPRVIAFYNKILK